MSCRSWGIPLREPAGLNLCSRGKCVMQEEQGCVGGFKRSQRCSGAGT
jgi:hypothetical protein